MALPAGLLDISKLLSAQAPVPPRNVAPKKIQSERVGQALKAVVPLVPIVKDVVDAAAQKVNSQEYRKVSAATAEMEDSMVPLVIDATRLYAMPYEELKALAVLEVKVPQFSGIGTPNDKRLGVLEDNELCVTCNKTNMDCPGHLGIITLRRSYINPMFGKPAIWVLQCVCNSCGRLLVDKTQIEKAGINMYRGADRLKRLAEICVKTPCRHRLGAVMDESIEERDSCGQPQPKGERKPCTMNPTYKPTDMKDTYIVYQEYNDKASGKTRAEISISEIEKIYCQIPRSDLRLMGFGGDTQSRNGQPLRAAGIEGITHPRDFILKAFAVLPQQARPHVYQDGELIHDYLTTGYMDIIRYNNRVYQTGRVHDENTENQRRNDERNLYFFISHFMDNSDKKYTRVKDEAILSVKDRVFGKTGYIRGHAMGKRVNFAGRTVLNPSSRRTKDPNDPKKRWRGLRFGEVGKPERMRQVLTTPEVVNRYNITRILEEYKEGKVAHLVPGTGKLKGQRFRITNKTRASYTPQIGDTVDRHGKSGDPVIFNRQPTLHKQAFMGYEAQYNEDETIQVHSSCTTPHNADFDGDEGNMHKPQTLGAQCETLEIAGVTKNIMNTQANRPMMGMVYNAISSCYMMCDDRVVLDLDEWEDAIDNLDDMSAITAGLPGQGMETQGIMSGWKSLDERLSLHGVRPYSGRALFSTLLPPDFYYDVGDVKIVDGVLKKGTLTKKHVGPAAGSIIHYLWKTYPQERVVRFFSECQFLSDWFIELQGLTVSLKDCQAPNETQIREIIDREIIQTQLKIDGLGPETPDMTPLEKEFREKQVQNFLNNLAKIGREIGLDALLKDNPLNIMSNSGAKGNETNTAQITGLLGQQFIKGARPKRTLTQGTRVMCYFPPNSTDIKAGGFIFENFMTGPRPAGMVFHMAASRIGLVDTAIRTSDTGAQHHRLAKVMEDVKIAYDGSVRNAGGVIFQFSFSDGFNAGELIPTSSNSGGPLVSFIDLKNVVGKLNHEAGFDYI